MRAIYKRELKSYFCSMTGYVFIAFMTMFMGMGKMTMKRKSTFMKSVSMRTAIVKRMAFFCLR